MTDGNDNDLKLTTDISHRKSHLMGSHQKFEVGDLKLTTDCSHRISHLMRSYENGYSYQGRIGTQPLMPRTIDIDELSEPSASTAYTSATFLNNTYPFSQASVSDSYMNCSLPQPLEHGRVGTGSPASGGCDLKPTLDCSHRKSSQWLRYNNNVLNSGIHNVMYVNRSNRKNHDISDTASVQSDLQLSVDCSHRRHSTVIGPRNVVPTNDAASCFSFQQTHDNISDTASVQSDLHLSRDLSHRRRKTEVRQRYKHPTHDTRNLYRIPHRQSIHIPLERNGDSLPEGRSAVSDLQLSLDCSHRNHHSKLRTSHNNQISPYLPSENTTESDLQVTLDCSHRNCKQRSSFGNEMSTDINVNHTYSLATDQIVTMDNFSVNNQGQDTAGLDPQVSFDHSHGSLGQCVDREPMTFKRNPSVGWNSDAGVRLSLDGSQSLTSEAEDSFDVTSGLTLSLDTSHRRRQSQPISRTQVHPSNIEVREKKASSGKSQHKKLQKNHARLKPSVCDENEERENNSNLTVDGETKVCSIEKLDKRLLQLSTKTADLGGQIFKSKQISAESIRKLRKRFRSGSDSNLVIMCKKTAMGRKLSTQILNKGLISTNSDSIINSNHCDKFLKHASDKNIPSTKENIMPVLSENSEAEHLDAACRLAGKVHVPRGACEKKTNKRAHKRRSWPGVDKKLQFINKVHKTITMVERNGGTALMRSTTAGNEDLNLSRLETLMPLNEENCKHERKAKHRFMRKNGVLYRRHDSVAIWESVVSKYVS